MIQRWALGVEYDGSDFHGWQRAHHGVRSVQGVLEDALSRVAAQEVTTVCAGRTDAGVHASGQVVHFDSAAPRTARAWMLGATSRLPVDVAATWCSPVSHDFSARFSARQRRYRYRILNRQVRPGCARQYVAWERRPLDASAMHFAAQALVGEHDFESFRSSQCEATHARRALHSVKVSRLGEEVHIDIAGNAFLHHMVRNIAGALLDVGCGRRPTGWIAELLAARDRRQGGVTAPAAGLLFLGPRYPAQFGLPAVFSLDEDEPGRARALESRVRSNV